MTIIHHNIASKPFAPKIYFPTKVGVLIKAGVLADNDEEKFREQRTHNRKGDDMGKSDFYSMIPD